METKEDLEKYILELTKLKEELTQMLDDLDKKAEYLQEMTSEDTIQVEQEENIPPVMHVYSRTRKHGTCRQQPLSALAIWTKRLGLDHKKTDSN